MNIVASATALLREEHRIITRVVDALDLELDGARKSGRIDPSRMLRFAEFLREFANGCHISKEERVLFPSLEHAGHPIDGGPMAALLNEHVREREHLCALDQGIRGVLQDEPEAPGIVIRNASALVDLLRKHIDKENHCLYGMAERVLSEEGMDFLAARFTSIQKDPGYRVADELGRSLARNLTATASLREIDS